MRQPLQRPLVMLCHPGRNVCVRLLVTCYAWGCECLECAHSNAKCQTSASVSYPYTQSLFPWCKYSMAAVLGSAYGAGLGNRKPEMGRLGKAQRSPLQPSNSCCFQHLRCAQHPHIPSACGDLGFHSIKDGLVLHGALFPMPGLQKVCS